MSVEMTDVNKAAELVWTWKRNRVDGQLGATHQRGYSLPWPVQSPCQLSHSLADGHRDTWNVDERGEPMTLIRAAGFDLDRGRFRHVLRNSTAKRITVYLSISRAESR